MFISRDAVLQHMHNILDKEIVKGKDGNMRTPLIYYHRLTAQVCLFDKVSDFKEQIALYKSKGIMPVKKENMGQPPSTFAYKGKTYDLKWWAFQRA
jgi:hypothetical protein